MTPTRIPYVSETVTPDQTVSASGSAATRDTELSEIVHQIKAITGKTNWYDAPDSTIAALATTTLSKFQEISFSFKGSLPTTNGTTTGTLRRPMFISGTIVGVRTTINGLPVGAGSTQTVDIIKGAANSTGSTIYTTTANRPSYGPSSNKDLNASLPNTLTCSAGDWYSANLVTAGSPSSGGDNILVVVRFSY